MCVEWCGAVTGKPSSDGSLIRIVFESYLAPEDTQLEVRLSSQLELDGSD